MARNLNGTVLATDLPSALVASLGAVVLAGWLGAPTLWIVSVRGSVAMVAATAFGFILAGVGLMAASRRSARALATRRAAASFLLVLSMAVAAEHLLGVGLVDFPGLHAQWDAANPSPGRMSPPTAFAFLLVAGLLLTLERPTRPLHACLMQLLAWVVVALGAVSLVAYDVAPESLMSWYRYSRMSLPTAAGFVAVGIATLTVILHSPRYEAVYAGHEDRKIMALTLGIVLVVFVAMGAAAFATMQRALANNLHSSLEQSVEDRTTLLANLFDNRIMHAAIVADRPGLQALMSRWATAPAPALRAQIRAEGSTYLGSGFRGLAFFDEFGRPIADVGALGNTPALEAPLIGQRAMASLVWDGEFLLRVRTPVLENHRWVGSVVTEQPLSIMSRLHLSTDRLGQTAAWVLCARAEDGMSCFPNHFEPLPFVLRLEHNRQKLPMSHALAGESGFVSAADYRGDSVIAAYRPVGTTGLGVVLKVGADEFYAPLREQLARWGLWLLAAAALVAMLVASQVRPVALRLVRSEALANLRAEDLARSERNLRELYHNLADGIVVLSLEGLIELINPAAERIFGYPTGELVGKPVSLLIPEYLREANADSTRHFAQTGQSDVIGKGDLVRPALRRDGTTVDIEFSLSEIRQESGPRLLGVVRDVSLRTAMERMKSEFVSTVSHELRTPLTSINGSLGLIAGGAAGTLPALARELVATASRNCERLIRLVNDILDAEKIEFRKMAFDLRIANLSPLVSQAVESNLGFAREHGARVSLAVTDEDLHAMVDGGRFHQAMTNLLSNAIKFSPHAGTVKVTLVRRGDAARLEVRDRGPGIPDEFRNRIFQRFSQADSSDTKQRGGTGLGLSIAKAIVERMGGTIGFESAVGEGTVFFFELPLAEAQTRIAHSVSTVEA